MALPLGAIEQGETFQPFLPCRVQSHVSESSAAIVQVLRQIHVLELSERLESAFNVRWCYILCQTANECSLRDVFCEKEIKQYKRLIGW